MVKKLSLASLLLVVGGSSLLLWGADFWESKPIAEWTDKDVQEVVTKSPWATHVDVDSPVQGAPPSTVRLVWRTALPIKQALAKGNGTLDTPATKAAFERQEPNYILQLVGMPATTRKALMDTETMMANTVLKVKGKPDMKPLEFQVVVPPAPAGGARGKGAAPGGGGAPDDAPPAGGGGGGGRGGGRGGGGGGRGGGGGGGGAAPGGGGGGGGFAGFGNVDVLISFPRTMPFTVEDKEVEFYMKVGKEIVKKTFKLKDMVVKGKIEM